MSILKDIEILSPGKRLRSVRKILGLKQGELAGDRFSKNYISMFENDKRSINVINATYLAKKINEMAEKKGKEVNINASYLLKNEYDMANDKCKDWIEKVENNLDMSGYEQNLNLFKVLKLSDEFGLIKYKGRALYLKGIHSFNMGRYECAISQFLEAINFFSKEDDYIALRDGYKSIGIILYKKNQFKEAVIYFKLSENAALKEGKIDINKIDEIRYYRALCHYNMEEKKIAKNIISRCTHVDDKIRELKEKIV